MTQREGTTGWGLVEEEVKLSPVGLPVRGGEEAAGGRRKDKMTSGDLRRAEFTSSPETDCHPLPELKPLPGQTATVAAKNQLAASPSPSEKS